MAKCECQVENEAEPLKAMAHCVEAEVKQFVGRRHQPKRRTVELSGDCASPGCFNIEVEGVGILNVVMKLKVDSLPAPGAMIIIGVRVGNEADAGQEVFGAGKVGVADEKIEINAGAEGRIAVNTFGEEGPLSAITGMSSA